MSLHRRREKINIMLIGYEKTGKTSLACRFLFDHFPLQNQNYFIDRHSSKIIQYAHKNIEVQLIDMHSLNQESFINKSLIKSQIHIYVYAIDNEESFHQIQIIRRKIYSTLGIQTPCILLANKRDKSGQRKVPSIQGQYLAQLWNTYFLEVSAKESDSQEIQKIFTKAIKQYKLNQYNKIHENTLSSFFHTIKNVFYNKGYIFQNLFLAMNVLNTFIGLFFLFFGTIFTVFKTTYQQRYGSILFIFIVLGVSQLIITVLGWYAGINQHEIVKAYIILTTFQLAMLSVQTYIIQNQFNRSDTEQDEYILQTLPFLNWALMIAITFTVICLNQILSNIFLQFIRCYLKKRSELDYIRKYNLDRYL